jgi:twinkle protein
MLDLDRLINRIEYAAKVYGVDVVMIDPVNEIDHQVPKGETKTDYMGKFIMRLKQLADDYNLLMIVAAHPPKDGVEKRLSKNGLLTLNDGADTAHYGNKADIGLCVWRNYEGPTLLHIDKLKDHETMGKPTLCELHLDEAMNSFTVGRIGYG